MTESWNNMLEIMPGIFQITITLKDFSPGSVNLYLIRDRSGLALIDTGWDVPAALEALQSRMSAAGLDFSQIKKVLVTHCHSDHLGMVNRLKRHNGATVYLHRDDMELIRMRYTPRNDYWQQTDEYLYTHGLPPQEVPALGYPLPTITGLVEPDVWMKGGEVIEAGDYSLRVINTPGHSPGHVAFYDPANRLLFSGDTLLPTIFTNAATHIQIMPDPLKQYHDSLVRLAELDVDLVLPGHETPFSDHRSRIHELLEHQRLRSESVYGVFRSQPGVYNAYQIARRLTWSPKAEIISWQQLSTWNKRFAMMQSAAHLEMLVHEHRLRRLTHDGVTEYQGPLES